MVNICFFIGSVIIFMENYFLDIKDNIPSNNGRVRCPSFYLSCSYHCEKHKPQSNPLTYIKYLNYLIKFTLYKTNVLTIMLRQVLSAVSKTAPIPIIYDQYQNTRRLSYEN